MSITGVLAFGEFLILVSLDLPGAGLLKMDQHIGIAHREERSERNRSECEDNTIEGPTNPRLFSHCLSASVDVMDKKMGFA